MATPTIKTKITLDGEKEYKKQLTEINSGLKVLRSEMNLTSEKFADQSDSVEALTAKNDVLERQILSQKEKIEAIKSGLQNAAESYGEAAKKTNDWKVSLNNAEKELLQMERAAQENADALAEAEQATEQSEEAYEEMTDAMGETEQQGKSLGEIVEQLAGKLGVDLPDGAKEAIDSVVKFDGKTALMAGTVATAVTAIYKLEKAMIALTKERAQVAAGIDQISQTIGFSVEATQEWDYVLRRLGSSVQEAQGDFSAFTEKIFEASQGEGEAAEMFALLGVNVRDLGTGALRPTEDILEDVVRALQLMDDETKRNAISSTLLGGTGEKLIPIYNETGEVLDAMMAKKHELGILSEEEIETLNRVNTSLVDYEARIDAAKDALAVRFAPYLEKFYEEAGEGVQDLAEAVADSGLVEALGVILDTFQLLVPLLDLAAPAIELLSPGIDLVTDALNFAADAMKKFNDRVKDGIDLMKNFLGGDSKLSGLIGGALFGPVWSAGKYLSRSQEPSMAASNYGRSGGDTYNVTIDAKSVKEFNDVVRMTQNKTRYTRMTTGRR